MQLVECLSGGVNGAGNGFARLYAYGTSARVAYYADFNGTAHASSGADLTLDSNGGSVVYVNQLTDIYVYDSAGNLVRSFTEGESAPATEVISASFTGTNRTTGVSGTSLPTTLQSVMDLWTTTNGAPDWKVLFGGVATSIQAAVAGVAGLFFNVKDPTYGAVADGVADDTTAIQNCINAAGVVKGIVFFPAGTYRITSALNVLLGVSMWGVGGGGSSGGTKIAIDHATNNTLSYNPVAITNAIQELRNITLDALQANSGNVINMGASQGTDLRVYNCALGNGGLNNGDLVSVGNIFHVLTMEGCYFRLAGSSQKGIAGDVNSITLRLSRCRFQPPATYNGTIVISRQAIVSGCTFDTSGVSAGTLTVLNPNGNGAGTGPRWAITGNEFIASGGATCTAISITNGNETNTAVSEAGNIFKGSWSSVYSGFTANSNIPAIQAVTRESLGFNVTSNAASLDVKADQYGYTSLTRTTTANQTLTANVGHGGATWTLIFFNNGGGASGVITFGTGFDVNTPTITGLANGKIATYHFRAVYVNGAAAWVPVSAQLGGL